MCNPYDVIFFGAICVLTGIGIGYGIWRKDESSKPQRTRKAN